MGEALVHSWPARPRNLGTPQMGWVLLGSLSGMGTGGSWHAGWLGWLLLEELALFFFTSPVKLKGARPSLWLCRSLKEKEGSAACCALGSGAFLSLGLLCAAAAVLKA